MDEKDFVSFETARKLKAAGYSEKCSSVWHFDGEKANFIEDYPATFHGEPNDFNNSYVFGLCIYSAPTLWQAQKWLREEKGILLWAYPDRQPVDKDWSDDELTGEWRWDIDGNESESSGDTYPSYEAAISAGIDEALNLIIKYKE